MNYATISADVISYTSLPEQGRRLLDRRIQELLNDLTESYQKHGFYGRLVQGDYIDCAMKVPAPALRIALLIKTFVKSFPDLMSGTNTGKLRHFSDHGIRLAVAVAPLSTLDPVKGVIDGEAIYLSGRTVKKYSTSDKQKVIIKNTMFFCSPDQKLEEQMNAIFALLDILLSKCSAKQSQVIYYKLLGMKEKEIARKLDKYQSTVSQHSTAAGWSAIENAVQYFEKTVH